MCIVLTKDLPDDLWGFNGGFSCKSFSKLHPEYQLLKKAVFEDNDDPWSLMTFVRGC